MTGAAKRKGDVFERAVAEFFREHGHPGVQRAYGAGRADDVGDLVGVPGFVIQCRNTQRIDLAGAVDAAEAQRGHAGARFGAAVVKRRGRGAADAYVVVSLSTFAELLEAQ